MVRRKTGRAQLRLGGSSIKALGCYIDSDDPEEIRRELESNDPHSKWRGQRPVELLRASSRLGKQCRVLLKDMRLLETFRSVVDTKRNHTGKMHILELAPEDMTNEIYIVGMTITWDSLEERLKKKDFYGLIYDLYGPGFSPVMYSHYLENDLKDALRFCNYWENARKQYVVRRASILINDYLGDGVTTEVGAESEYVWRNVDELVNEIVSEIEK